MGMNSTLGPTGNATNEKGDLEVRALFIPWGILISNHFHILLFQFKTLCHVNVWQNQYNIVKKINK